jgi:hypothetical protein
MRLSRTAHVGTWPTGMHACSDSDYGLDQVFPEMLKASAYVTTNPEEADYFVLDAWLFWPDGSHSFDEVNEWLGAAGPWWARKQGRDHVFVLTGGCVVVAAVGVHVRTEAHTLSAHTPC